MIPAALLWLIVPGCADQQPTSPKPTRIGRAANVSFNRFFLAWSQNYSASPIQTQLFALDTRQDRQFAGVSADDGLLAFAMANPGRLYINSDEPDQWCITPSEYADIYHDFVAALRRADPTARVSPAGFAEPNWHCCPPPDDVPAPCWSNIHSINYAEQFYNAYLNKYGVAPPVNEWRFHDFGLAFVAGDLDGWWARIDKEATWSVAHGANMVLGAWGFSGWREPAPVYQEHLKQAMNRLINDPRINSAVYWSNEQWGENHWLANPDGSLTAEGQTYANPLTDIPTDVTAVSPAEGQVKLQWTNTTSAWAAEAEFWVRSKGASSFTYKNTEMVAGPGGTQTPADVFAAGDSVKGRVRYTNAFGQAAWSSFSDPVYMVPPEPPAPKTGGSRKSPSISCLLPKELQSPECQ